MSDNALSRSTTPITDLLELTQQLTPHKSPGRARQICFDIQSLVNDVGESHSAVKRKLADVTNQLGTTRQPRKRRMRGNRATEAPEDVENPETLEDRVRKAGRHFIIEYGLFLFAGIHALLATEEDPNFSEDTEFDSESSRIQGQLRDITALLPADARAIREQEWIVSAFNDGMNNKRSTVHSRLRHESLVLIIANVTFSDGEGLKVEDFESSSSRFNALSKRIGYQPATEDSAAFYSILKAEVLFADYDGTMDVNKIFRGRLLLNIYACIIRGPQGAKGLFDGNSKLPAAKVSQRIHDIKYTTPAAIVSSAVWAIWLLSADTQLSASGEGDETKINYKFYFQTFLRQICEGLRNEAEWAVELFHFWDEVLFPNAEHSLGQTTSTNHQAVGADIEAMDEAFRAATQRREASAQPGPSREGSPEHQSTPPRQPSPPAQYYRPQMHCCQCLGGFETHGRS
ncbi:hypothetical protein DFH07DRAFT_1055741 [Mycena maculata]|uniref:Uncharacterized protein n=1 Tax=Mycena maculata TaxID=230809 RepID=A0AAD7NYB8_9AGAR|nr:hypothetical protein DFH07DRAFT_1055741 [Mycena maculata]